MITELTTQSTIYFYTPVHQKPYCISIFRHITEILFIYNVPSDADIKCKILLKFLEHWAPIIINFTIPPYAICVDALIVTLVIFHTYLHYIDQEVINNLFLRKAVKEIRSQNIIKIPY